MKTWETLPGKRIRAIVDGVENSEAFHGKQEERGRAGDPPLACVADMDVARGHVQWRNPSLEARRGAAHASSTEGVGAAISVWIAGERYRVSGQELMGGEGKLHARQRDFKVLQPKRGRTTSTPIIHASLALTRKMVDGEKDAKARLVAKGKQGPDPGDGLVDACGCVSLRSLKMGHLDPGHQECLHTGRWFSSRCISSLSCVARS